MKILYLHNTPPDSQMANLIQAKAMCKAMSESGLDVVLSLPTGKDGVYYNPEIDKLPYSINLRKTRFRNQRLDKYLNFTSIKSEINKENPDIIYLRSPLLLRQAYTSTKPIIIELHNYQLHQGYNWLDRFWKQYLIKKSRTDQIKKIVCISNALADYWEKQGLPADKIVVAHDGIDAEQFKNPLTVSEARKQLNLPVNTKIVTYLGRLYRNRKIENIVSLAEKYPEALFMVVGGPNEAANEMKANALKISIKNVMYLGQVPHQEINTYLYASDVLLALWSSEVKTINYCSPLKLFEYMGAGRIIVAHGFPTIKEVLQDKKNALICKPESIDNLIDKTGVALSMTYPNEMAAKAREDVFKNYTWSKRAENIFSGISEP